MRLRIIEIVRLYQAIESVRQRTDLNKKFSYALVRTKASIQSVYDAVAEMEKLSPGYQQYEQKRIAALRQYGKLADDGQLQMNGTSAVLADPEGYAAALEEIQGRHADAILERQANQKEVMEHVKGFDEVQIYRVPFDALPEVLSPVLMEGLFPMLDDESN